MKTLSELEKRIKELESHIKDLLEDYDFVERNSFEVYNNLKDLLQKERK